MGVLKTPGFFEDWIDGCKIFTAPLGSSADPSFLRSFYRRCVTVFANLARYGPVQRSRVLKTALSKLALWAEGFSDTELDRGLGEAPHLKNAILELLSSLGDTLVKVSSQYQSTSSYHMAKHDFSYHLEGLKAALRQAQEIIQSQLDTFPDDSDSGSSSDSENEDISTFNSTTPEVEELSIPPSVVEEIDHYVSCLMKLLAPLESVLNIPRPPEEAHADITPLQVSSLAFPYVHQIRDKFKDCDSALAERLGEANWQRYHILRSHMDKKEDTEEAARPDTNKTTFTPISLFHDSGYATTSASNSSFLTTQTEANSGFLRVPETPQEVAAGKPFSCFICDHTLRSIRNRSEWKIHVFADIRPYVCTFTKCNNALQMYPTRKQWADHEFSVHHQVSNTPRQCPFCKISVSSGRKFYTSHVSRHMESIALVTIPRESEPEHEIENESDSTPSETSALIPTLIEEALKKSKALREGSVGTLGNDKTIDHLSQEDIDLWPDDPWHTKIPLMRIPSLPPFASHFPSKASDSWWVHSDNHAPSPPSVSDRIEFERYRAMGLATCLNCQKPLQQDSQITEYCLCLKADQLDSSETNGDDALDPNLVDEETGQPVLPKLPPATPKLPHDEESEDKPAADTAEDVGEIVSACVHCLRQHIRCILEPTDPQNRCSNCVKLKVECKFYPAKSTVDGPPSSRSQKFGSSTLTMSEELNKSISTPHIGKRVTAEAAALQLSVKKRRNKLGYHRNSGTCVVRELKADGRQKVAGDGRVDAFQHQTTLKPVVQIASG